jgi:signal transduction histidine kinase
MEKMRFFDRISLKFALFYSLFFLFLLLGLTSLQAKELETLFLKFDKAETKDKPEIALKIGEKYNADFAEKQEQYLQLGLQVAQQLNNKSAECNLLISLANHYKKMGKIVSAMELLETAVIKSEHLPDEICKLDWRITKADFFIYQGKISDAIDLLEEALEFAEANGIIERQGLIFNDLGRSYMQINYYEKAFDYYQKAYHVYEKENEISGMGSSLVNIANVYQRTNQMEEAISTYRKASEYLKQAGSTLNYANAMNNLAAAYVKLEDYTLALETHHNALSLYEQLGNTNMMAYSLYNIGNLKRNMEEYNSSDSYYQQSLHLFERNNYPKGIASCTIGLAENLILQKKYKEAIDAILIAENDAELLETPQQKLSIYNLYVHYYSGIGDYERAFDALTNTHEIRNAISAKRHNDKLIEMQTKFQIDQKIKQIELLQKDKKIYQLRLLTLMIALIGFAGIAILYRYRFIEKSKANKLIQTHEKELEMVNIEQKELLTELEELNFTKNKLFSILAHDLKNGFTALMKGTKLLSERIHMMNAQTIPVIAEELHKSSVTMYEMLQNLITWGQVQSKKIDIQPRVIMLQEKVESICKLLAPLAEEKKIVLERTISDSVKVFADSPTLSSVLQNLFHNAIKFTDEGGKISIRCEEWDKHIRIFISDNGVGIKTEAQAAIFDRTKMHRSRGTKGEKGTGLGLLIVKEFVEMNNGTLSFESEYGKGTTFVITLPREEAVSSN